MLARQQRKKRNFGSKCCSYPVLGSVLTKLVNLFDSSLCNGILILAFPDASCY